MAGHASALGQFDSGTLELVADALDPSHLAAVDPKRQAVAH